MSEKASIVGDVRRALQDSLAPELGELKTQLNALSDNLRDGLKAQTNSQREMEVRLIREIKNSEHKLALMFKLSEAMEEAEGLKNENEQLKREKTQ